MPFRKLPPEFWEWASGKGLPPRQPRNSPGNVARMLKLTTLMAKWRAEHREVHNAAR